MHNLRERNIRQKKRQSYAGPVLYITGAYNTGAYKTGANKTDAYKTAAYKTAAYKTGETLTIHP